MSRAKNIKGLVFGNLTVIEQAQSRKTGKSVRAFWVCACVCGNEAVYRGDFLREGRRVSCGCLVGGKTHGMSYTRTYSIWKGMRERCDNPSNAAYPRYGAKGVTYCDSWAKFDNFLKDMGEVPEGLTLDRIDNDLGYEKDNCRWADWFTQAANRGGMFAKEGGIS